MRRTSISDEIKKGTGGSTYVVHPPRCKNTTILKHTTPKTKNYECDNREYLDLIKRMVSNSESLFTNLLISNMMKMLETRLKQFLQFLFSSMREPVSTTPKSACVTRMLAFTWPFSSSATEIFCTTFGVTTANIWI